MAKKPAMDIKGKIDFSKALKKVDTGSERGVKQALEHISKQVRVPRDTGATQISERLIVKGKEGALGYDTDQALYTHERPELGHHKWLEKVIMANKDRIGTVLGNELKKEVK